MSRTLETLRQAVLSSEKSRYRIAIESRVSAGQLSRLVNSKRGLSVESAERLATALGMEIKVVARPKRAKEK